MLVYTFSYMDAIMNSLALAFIIDIQSILYANMASNQRKAIISQVAAISVRSPLTRMLNRGYAFSPASVVHIASVAILSLLLCLYQREKRLGWLYVGEAIRCFCGLEGNSC